MPPQDDDLTTAKGEVGQFYNTLNTLPRLIGNIASEIAESQRRLDEDYLDNLAAFTKVVHEAFGNSLTVEQYLTLFKAIAPSRYQFTETAIEVRADIQTASAQELNIGVNVGITKGVFAAAVNLSYMKRSGSQFEASAVIRTTVNAIPSDSSLLDKLLLRAGPPPTEPLSKEALFKALLEGFKHLPEPVVTSPPHHTSPPK